MNDFLSVAWGSGSNLNALQMAIRAVVMFFIALTMIRIAGIGSFGTGSAFDKVIVIMLGAVLSRGIVGASAFLPIVIAGLVLCLVHRTLAFISLRSDAVGKIIKGQAVLLYSEGTLHRKNMNRCHISDKDLKGYLRLRGGTDSFEDVKEIFFERTGEISIVKKILPDGSYGANARQ